MYIDDENRFEYFSRWDRDEAAKKADNFYSFIKSVSVAPPERPIRIKELIQYTALGIGTPLIINWICPVGTPLEFDSETNKLYRRYAPIDPVEGFQKDYRIISRIGLEKRLTEMIGQIQSSLEYVKIVADNNPYCLYPACLRLDGEIDTRNAIETYTGYVQTKLDELIGSKKVAVLTLSSLLGQQGFEEFMNLFKETQVDDLLPFLPNDVLKTEVDIISKHTKLDTLLEPKLESLATDVIRQYAVEGFYLYKMFGDSVILAWNESTRRSQIIDSLRKARGIPPLPKIFVLHEKGKGLIIDNY